MPIRRNNLDRDTLVVRSIAGGLLVTVLVLFFQTWHQPLLESHGFRQPQTALSAYWLRDGADFLRYITPALGYPWSVPFELPWYQWLAAHLSALTGLELDPSGRLVSLIFSIATIWPAAAILRIAGCS